MATKVAYKRLQKEYTSLQKSPPPFIFARANESNILDCHFILRGPDDSPYAGGEYWGIVSFPSEYPFKPPGIKLLTPSGRFQPDRKICTSMSDYHPGTWNPAWSVSTILTGLLSFMLSDEITTGSVRCSDEEKRVLARASHDYNRSQPRFRTVFPEYSGAVMTPLPNMGEHERGNPSTTTPATSNTENSLSKASAKLDNSASSLASSTTNSLSSLSQTSCLATPPAVSSSEATSMHSSPSSTSVNSTFIQNPPSHVNSQQFGSTIANNNDNINNNNNDNNSKSKRTDPPTRQRNIPWYFFAGMAVLVSIIILKLTD